MRLFIALAIPDQIQSDIAASFNRLPLTFSNYKLVERHNIHVTLKFIGETPVAEVPAIITTLSSLRTQLEATELWTVAGLVLSASKPRVLALSVEPRDKLTRIFHSIDTALAQQGIAQPERKKFIPHLTLARTRHNTPALTNDVEAVRRWIHDSSWTARLLVLFESILSASGPTYHALQSFKLS